MKNKNAISIVTPHYNDFQGLQAIYTYLQQQTAANWEWIVVDDLSDLAIKQELQVWFDAQKDERIRLICNSVKTTASICRNTGADASSNELLVFLDSDDKISKEFVANRHIEFEDFAIFLNNAVVDKQGKIEMVKAPTDYHLNCFLQAKFIYPITAVLWDKIFFNSIGKFNSQLPRLQDVELAIRALQQSSAYLTVDNTVDFYYNVIPIRERKNFLKPVCESVYLLISELLNSESLDSKQKSLLSGYYYLCVRYLERSGAYENVHLVRKNLLLFYKRNYVGMLDCAFGLLLLKLFVWRLLSPSLFLRINRRVFKP